MYLLIAALKQKKGVKNRGPKFILGLGVFMPVVVVSGILVYSLSVSYSLKAKAENQEGAYKIIVTGHQWWWEVVYPDFGITTANELHIPAGKNVEIELRSNDVIHSFWVPSLHGKLDALPDHSNTLVVRADRPGVFRGQCAEFCGRQHALMGFHVVSLEERDFEEWVKTKQSPVATREPELLRGREIFFKAACDNCHSIQGTEADGKIGPDLTHIGTRLSLGAATIPNGHQELADWISDPQKAKPGNLMPPTPLSRKDLEALQKYLSSLGEK